MNQNEPKDIKEAQNNCTHLGTHNPATQNVLQAPEGIMVVISHNCAYCGKVFCVINPLDLSEFKKNKLIKPESTFKV